MSEEITLKVNRKYQHRYQNGYPLLLKEAIPSLERVKTEGTMIKLIDDQGCFIGKGYYGKQNKGFGWMISHNETEKINEGFFEKVIRSALLKRNQLYQNKNTNAFRVFNGEGDGIGGFTIDYFNGFYLINWYNKGIYKFKDTIIRALEKVTTYEAIYQKKRFATAGRYVEDDDYVKGIRGQFPIIVKENGMNFAIYLNDGAMVGVFLDQREVRKTIKDHYATGKMVLNLFSYTGAFSVAAALGGAVKTTSVDLANRSRAKTIEQFSMNGIDYETHDIIVEDVFQYFKYAIRKKLKFDLVILDPPSFARSKKYTFSAAKDYKNLLKETIAITEDNGIIIASTNCSTFQMKKFKSFIDAAFKETGEKYKLLEEFSLPEDFKTINTFKEGNYLKVVFIQKLKK